MTAANQKAFNKAYRGLRSQHFAISTNGSECAYRGDGGLRCAAGWLIPNSKYCKEWEGRGAYRLPPGTFGAAEITLIGNLQAAHDNAADPTDMQRRLAEVAQEYDLTIPA